MGDQTQGGDPPAANAAPFTDAQLEQISQVAGQVANSAFAARAKKLEEKLGVEFKTGLEGITRQLTDLAANASAGKTGKKGKDGGAAEEPDAADPKFNGMQRQLSELKSQLDARDKELAGEKAKQKLAALRQSAREELGKLGIVEPPRVKAALATLEADGRLGVDDEGQNTYIENANSVVDLATGIRAWGKTDDAKIFIPASGARGSGDRPGQGGAGKPGAAPKETTDADVGLALVATFGGSGVPMG